MIDYIKIMNLIIAFIKLTPITKYKYLLDYQPIFVEVTYRYLLSLI